MILGPAVQTFHVLSPLSLLIKNYKPDLPMNYLLQRLFCGIDLVMETQILVCRRNKNNTHSPNGLGYCLTGPFPPNWIQISL